MRSKCTVSGTGWDCDRLTKARGVCETHYHQWLRGKPFTKIRQYGPHGRASRYDPHKLFNDVDEGFQICSRCEETKPVSDFYYHKRNGTTDTVCKKCRVRKITDGHHGKGAADWKINQLAEQGGICKICETDNPGSKRGWHLHHDHNKEGADSWLWVLCSNCNTKLVAGLEHSVNPKLAMDFLIQNFETITGEPYKPPV